MPFDSTTTIVASGSGAASAPRAIVRISGKDTRSILSQLLTANTPHEDTTHSQLLSAARASHAECRCRLTWEQRSIETRVYFWPDHRCYTGEPSAEIHLLGSRPIVDSLIEKIYQLGAKAAERGEFTLRAFLAGKLDLPQAEAVLGVIEADSKEELFTALGQLGGNISHPVRELRSQIVELLAHLEAGLDFVEEDIEFIGFEQLERDLGKIAAQLQEIIELIDARGARGHYPRVVLWGLPNAGKSSLFNALLGHERAIVSWQAGTTRDALVEVASFGGTQAELVDTAGDEVVSATGSRAIAQQVLNESLNKGDCVLLCGDLADPSSQAWCNEQAGNLETKKVSFVRVGTKLDLISEAPPAVAECNSVCVSLHDSDSLDRLRFAVRNALASSSRRLGSEAMQETTLRCRNALVRATASLEQAIELVASFAGEELVASELRIALEDLSAVIGEVHNEDILGEIFSRFCIGK